MRLVTRMHWLRSLPLVASFLLGTGCGEEDHAPLRPAGAAERERDSVIARCRDLLSARPNDPDLCLLLGSSLLQKYVARSRSAGGILAGDFILYGTSLNDIGKPVDSVAAIILRSTLREAGEHIAMARALAPRNPATLKELGLLALTSWPPPYGYANYDTAAAFLSQALAADPGLVDAYEGLAACRLRRHEDGRAIALLRLSIGRDSTRGSTYLMMGEAYSDSGLVPLAFACLENAARLGLEAPVEYIEAARHYIDDLAEAKMLGKLAALRREGPRPLRPVVRGALKLIGMYHPDIALRLAARALALDSTYAPAHLFRAQVFLEEGDTSDASDELIAAIRLGTAPFNSYGRFPPGLVEEACSQCEYRPVLSLLAGTAYMGRRAPRKCLPFLRKAAGDMPGSSAAAYLLGRGLLLAGDTVEAYRWFDRALDLPPGASPEMYWDLPRVFMKSDQIPKMVLAYRKMNSVIETPLYIELYRREGTAGLYSRDVLSLAAAECAAGYDCSWAARGADTERLKRHAVELFLSAHRLTPASGIPELGLGNVYLDTGNRREALRYYRAAAAKGNPDAKVNLQRLATSE